MIEDYYTLRARLQAEAAERAAESARLLKQMERAESIEEAVTFALIACAGGFALGWLSGY